MEEGFIRNYKFIKDKKQGILRVYLKYDDEQTSAIFGLKRVSKPSRRVYVKGKDVKPVLNGMGIAILSTSKGIMTDKKARAENVGGEILCNIW
jgi:small subunit ribosomal protein S8